MRSIVLTFLLVALCDPAGAQQTDLTALKKRLERLQHIRRFPMDSTGIAALPPFDYYCDDETPNPYPYYHVLDVNNDGLNDLVYSGPCLPYDQTGIFANTGNSLVCIFSYPGKVIALDHNEIQSEFHILKEPCCCDLFFDYTQVIVRSNSEVVENRITFASGTVVTVDNPVRVNIKGVLRTTPQILDEEEKDSCSEEVVTGNHLLILRKPTEVIQLHQQKKWRLVLYEESEEQSWIGWIKSKTYN